MTSNANHVRVGQLWRDRRKDNIRTLKVTRIEDGQVHLLVVRQEYRGEVTTPMRATDMTMGRLLSRNFEFVQEPER